MSSVADHVAKRLLRSPVITAPFPHFFVRNVFPAETYREMLASLPASSEYEPSAYDNRVMLDVPKLGGVWSEISTALIAEPFIQALCKRFHNSMRERFPVEQQIGFALRLVRDGDGYEIRPHTDNPRKILSLLFYLPPDESLIDHGTRFYEPLDGTLRCDGSVRHPFEMFRETHRFPMLPNSCLVFFKTDRAFHGVPPIHHPGLERNVLLLNIAATKDA